MFGGSSNNKNKRRSFFLFGNDSKVAPAPAKPTEKRTKGVVSSNTSKPKVNKHHHSGLAGHPSSKNDPLSRSPLMNFGDDPKFENENKDKIPTQRPQAQTQSSQRIWKKEDTNMGNDITPGSSIYSTPSNNINGQNTSLGEQQNTIQSAPVRNRIRRPPPPALDMGVISRTYESSSSSLNGGEVKQESRASPIVQEVPSSVPLNHYENILESSSEDEHSLEVIDNDKPMEINSQKPDLSNDRTLDGPSYNMKQHRRQRSEAESLVDDLDLYIKEYKENSKSVEDLLPLDNFDNNEITYTPGIEQSLYSGHSASPNMKMNVEAIKTDFDYLTINDEPSPESSLLYMSPLDVGEMSTRDSSNQRQFSRNTLTITNIASNESNSSNERPDTSDSSDDSNSSNSGSNFSFSNSVDEGDDSGIEKQIDQNSEVSFTKIHKEDIDSTNIMTNTSSQPFLDTTETLTQAAELPQNHATDNLMRESISFNGNETLRDTSNVSTDDYTIETVGENVSQNEEGRKTFRIANEDHPTFYIKDDTSVTDNDTSTIRSSETDTDINQISSSSLYNDDTEMGIVNVQDMLPPALSTFVSNESSIDSTTPQKISSNTPDNTTLSGEKSLRSVQSISGNSIKSTERTSKLVSGYVEELRLKYFQTSNFLQAPPNLPLSLKQKNNLIKPRNIKVKIRTNTKQVGIKHGKVKQKLLSFETSTADNKNLGFKKEKNNAAVDHTKEFHNFFNKDNSQVEASKSEDNLFDSNYMADIPGDEAYNSDDILAPLREEKGSHNTVSRNSTVVSYYTRSKNRMHESDSALPDLPTNVSIGKYKTKDAGSITSSTTGGRFRSDSLASISSHLLTSKVSGSIGLRVANPDSDSD